MDSVKNCVWGLELRDRPMTVCVCVSSTKRRRGWCASGKGLCVCMYRRAGVWECVCEYVSVCSLNMVIFSSLSAMHNFAWFAVLQAKQQILFYERVREFTKSRVMGSQGHHGEQATVRCLALCFSCLAVNLLVKGTRCRLRGQFCEFPSCKLFFIKMQINSVTILTGQGSVFDTLRLKSVNVNNFLFVYNCLTAPPGFAVTLWS